MAESQPVVVGSETQFLETFGYVTGIQRVLRETHLTLTDMLSPDGVRVAPMHTRDKQPQPVFRTEPYLAGDPVLDQHPVRPEDVDAIMFLDLHTDVDFARVFQARRVRRLPVVTLVHDILPITNPDWCVEDPRRAFRLYVQQVMAVSDHIVVTSGKVKSDLLSLGWHFDGEFHVFGLGTSFRQRAPEPPPDDRISMMFVSTIDPRKGHAVLLDAYDLLRARGCDVDLTLVGREGWRCAHVIERLRTHPDIGGRLRWLHHADDLTVATVARGCSIGLFPAADEGFGLFLEEGLSYGLKMVVSDIPVFRERVQPNVVLAERTAEGLADAILRAHATSWVPRQPGDVRTMHDFGRDVANLVRSVLP